MIIQVNTDHKIDGSERLTEYVKELINGSLSRFTSHLTRIEVHITEDGAHKGGQGNKKCVLEARVEGMQPIAVTEHAETADLAVKGGLDKLKAALSSIMGKLNDREHMAKDVLAGQ